MTKIWWISIRTLKSLKHLHFAWFVLCKPYHVWPKKHREVFFYDTEELCKIWRKTCGLQNEMRNLANFNQNTWKCQNWYFHKIFLPKIENTCAKNLQRSYDTVMTLKNDEKSEQELTCSFKIYIMNLTNFDSSTRKYRKITLSLAAYDQSISCLR